MSLIIHFVCLLFNNCDLVLKSKSKIEAPFRLGGCLITAMIGKTWFSYAFSLVPDAVLDEDFE